MRIRIPEADINVPEDPKLVDNPYSVTYKVKVITPIYGGGVKAGEPDMEMPIRASAIRGQLRYWWRFLKMNDPVQKNRLEGVALFREERRVWGGIGDEKELKESGEKDFSSKVFIRVNVEPINGSNVIKASEKIGRNNGIAYALFSAVQGRDDDLIKEGIEFEIFISSNDLENKDWEDILKSFQWWSCFGGIGARTRRGLGSVEVLFSTDKSYKVLTKEDVEKINGCSLEEISAHDAHDAWNKAVGKLHHFRQVEFQYNRNGDHTIIGIGRKTKREQKHNDNEPKTYPSRSNWPEADSIREIVGQNTNGHDPVHLAKQSFPRAAFGLPIIFDFNQDAPPGKSEVIPILNNTESDDSRMASPLILKAMKVGIGYKSIALKMPNQHLNNLTIRLKNSGEANNRHLPKDFTNGTWKADDKAEDISPIYNNNGDNNATNALDAFMNYFANGGN